MQTTSPFRLRLAFAAAMLAFAAALPAQELIMKDGRKIPAPGAVRRGDKIFVSVSMGAGTGQIAYDINQIAGIKLPDSPQMADAIRLLADDKAAEALAQIEQVIRPVEAFRGMGDDRWGQAMLLKSTALMELDMQQKALEVLNDLVSQDGDSDAGRVARLRLASLEGADPKKADEWLRLADTELAEANPANIRAEASLLKAKVLLDREEYEKALRAALFVTIFYSDERMDVSRAQLLAGECYLNMGDKPRAVRAYRDVVVDFPKTAAAAAAQKEISKGGEPFAVIVQALDTKEKENQNKLKATQAETAPASKDAAPASTPTPNP